MSIIIIADLDFESKYITVFSWIQLEPKEGVYDFTWLNKVPGLRIWFLEIDIYQ